MQQFVIMLLLTAIVTAFAPPPIRPSSRTMSLLSLLITAKTWRNALTKWPLWQLETVDVNEWQIISTMLKNQIDTKFDDVEKKSCDDFGKNRHMIFFSTASNFVSI
jgi:hypothetical protein